MWAPSHFSEVSYDDHKLLGSVKIYVIDQPTLHPSYHGSDFSVPDP
jgi:hypothetical protein